MALQLIDLNEDVEYIDIDVSKVPYSFSIKLTDKTYTFTVKYNEVGKFFTVDLLDLNALVQHKVLNSYQSSFQITIRNILTMCRENYSAFSSAFGATATADSAISLAALRT